MARKGWLWKSARNRESRACTRPNERIQSEKDYAILTSEISKATFGLTLTEYKQVKGLTRKTQNLRDHMTDLEKKKLPGKK